jgi:hypothetical protein
LRRFQNALAFIGQQRQLDWASVALACGNHDEAHFNRGCREFSYLSPTQYLTNRADHQNTFAMCRSSDLSNTQPVSLGKVVEQALRMSHPRA